jgi:hypothetical protein
MSLAPTHPSPTESLPFLPDLLTELADWEARHAAAIQKTFLFVHPETRALWYAVLGTSPVHDEATTLPEELAEFALRVRRQPRFAGAGFDAEFFLRDSGDELEYLSRGMIEVRRDG